MRVECQIDHGEQEGDYGTMVPCTTATCGRCGHSSESFGTGEGSIKRCLVLLREECPNGESNFYVEE